MAKKIFGVYLAKLDAPDSEAHTRLELPASPWELHDAMDKVQLQENEELYLEVDDYYDFEYLAPHLDTHNHARCIRAVRERIHLCQCPLGYSASHERGQSHYTVQISVWLSQG